MTRGSHLWRAGEWACPAACRDTTRRTLAPMSVAVAKAGEPFPLKGAEAMAKKKKAAKKTAKKRKTRKKGR